MKAFYDEFDYAAYWQGRHYEDKAEKIALKKFFDLIPQKDSLIDIGAGFGRHTKLYAPLFNRCLLVDPSENSLAQARRDLGSYSNLTFRVGKAEMVPAAAESFQVALLIRVIHHLEKPADAFREVFRILKPGGFLVLEFANKIHFLARVRAIIGGDFSFVGNLLPQEQRSTESIRKGKINFSSHHPQKIEKDLLEAGFAITSSLSVSNLRFSLFKRTIPSSPLLFLENILQNPLAKFYFGPSIFILAKKVGIDKTISL
jgi:ubiquinone/menaquinone biosynthesis C-methylase UbiE